jgi:hypothetical protein
MLAILFAVWNAISILLAGISAKITKIKTTPYDSGVCCMAILVGGFKINICVV